MVRHTIIFTIGRMNPPTPGHMKLIQTIMEANEDLPAYDKGRGRVYIILSHTKDNKRNPLSCDRKKNLFLANGMIDRIKTNNPRLNKIDVDILCTYEPNEFSEECGKTFIISQLCRIIKSEEKKKNTITNAELILGSDRQGAFGQIPDYFSNKNITFNEIGPYGTRLFQKYDDKLSRIEPKGNEAYIDNESMIILPENMSGTLIRSLVEKNQESRFVKLYENAGLSKEEATSLFHELVHELYNKGPSVKTVKVKKPSASKAKEKSASPIETMKSTSPIEASALRTPSPPPTKTRRGRSAATKVGGGLRLNRGLLTKKHTHKHNKNKHKRTRRNKCGTFTISNFMKKLGM